MGHLDILNLLMFWGCYVDGIDNEGRTVLSVAAAEGSTPIVKVTSSPLLSKYPIVNVM